MRYRRKKTAPVSVRLQCQQPVDGHWKNKTAARGLAEVMVGKTVVYTGANGEFEMTVRKKRAYAVVVEGWSRNCDLRRRKDGKRGSGYLGG
jgi:hypothetical protein